MSKRTGMHPSIQAMIDSGRFSYEPVEGWDFCFIDGMGWGTSGWMPPPPPPEFPVRDDLREWRKSLRMSIGEMATAIGENPARLSGFERGRVRFTPTQEQRYIAYLQEREAQNELESQ